MISDFAFNSHLQLFDGISAVIFRGYFISILSSNLSILLFLMRYLMLIFVRSLSYQQFSIIIENKKQLHECEECAENVAWWSGSGRGIKHLNISPEAAGTDGEEIVGLRLVVTDWRLLTPSTLTHPRYWGII